MRDRVIGTADGVSLHYEVLGDGPVLLVIQAGLGHAGTTGQFVSALTTHYRVVTYDRRGLARSPVSPSTPSSLSLHADDAAALLSALSPDTPAFVLGVSIGAAIGLHLLARHPHLVARLVAHEPPLPSIVTDPAREASLDQVAALAEQDVRQAIRLMANLTEPPGCSREVGAQAAPPVGDLDSDLRRFFDWDFPAVRTDLLTPSDLAFLAASRKVALTGGDESRGRWEHRCAEELAHRLGVSLVETPGGHNGPVSHPWATAAMIPELLGNNDG